MVIDYRNESEFTNAWGGGGGGAGAATAPDAGGSSGGNGIGAAGLPSIESTVAKEQRIKDIVQLRDGLRGLLVRITEVEGETDKLRKDNEFLGTYIDNLTRNSVVAAAQKR